MKKIAYIELDTHAEVASNFLELAKDSKKFETDFYFSKKILKILNLKVGENIFEVSPDNVVMSLKEKKYDEVIIGTAHRYFDVFHQIIECFYTSIIVHNLNFIKAKRWHLLKSVLQKEVKFRLKLLLKENLLQMPLLYQKAKRLWVLDEQLQLSEKMFYLPLFFQQVSGIPFDDEIKLVVSGQVSQKRRDYLAIIKRLKTLSLEKKMKVIFLGKASGEELSWLRNLKLNNIEIEYFTEKVSQDIFDEKMRSATALWCPIQEETTFFSLPEYYGKTKFSGNIGDAIKYGKIAILPGKYVGKYPFAISEADFSSSMKIDAQPQYFAEYSKAKVLKRLENNILTKK